MFWKTELGKILIALLVIVVFFLPFAIYLIRLNSQPIQIEHVEVVEKKTRDAYYHSSGGGVKKTPKPNGYVTFKFADGSKKEFPVGLDEIYNILKEGDTGMLSYKQVKDSTELRHLRFVSFEKDE